MNENPDAMNPVEERDTSSRRGLRLLDLAALVVGYSMAALLIRAFWPETVRTSIYVAAGLGIEYLWLGLAMSGPFVLLLDRRRRKDREAVPTRFRARPGRWPADTPASERMPEARYTGPELAWLLIGGYWIGMTVLVVPARLAASSAPLLGLLPFVAAAFLSFLGPKRPFNPDEGPAWTHRAAIVLLSCWPIAWIGLIALTQAR